MFNIPINKEKLQAAKDYDSETVKNIAYKSEFDEFDEITIKMIFKRMDYESFSDMFIEYSDFIKELSSEYKVVEDFLDIDNTKVVIAPDCNDHYLVEMYSDYMLQNIYMCESTCDIPYGVCDNASQIFDLYKPNDDEVILMTPIFKITDPDWRWHKWGPYIGVHHPRHEYIMDEEDIDYVFVFSIYKIVKYDN